MVLTDASLAAHSSIRHGFFTRQGGVSEGIYASLNCGLGSKDNPEHVRRNRAIVAESLGVSAARLCTVYQVHGVEVAPVEQPWDYANSPSADAMVTATPNVILGILTADCVPILFADAKHRIIGAAHAGWKGALGNIMEATLKAMELLGASRGNVTAVIGPAIAQASYEVGPEFIERFLKADPSFSRFFLTSDAAGKHRFDIKGFVSHRLSESGISAKSLANDTCIEEDRFFSYRRATLRGEPDYGRHISAIMLTE